MYYLQRCLVCKENALIVFLHFNEGTAEMKTELQQIKEENIKASEGKQQIA
jgi:hypothetical protein